MAVIPNAAEAKFKSQEVRDAKARKLSKKVEKFIGNYIVPAVLDATESGEYGTSVKIPKKYNRTFIDSVARSLTMRGYDIAIVLGKQYVEIIDVNWEDAASGRRGTAKVVSRSEQDKNVV